MNPVAILDSSTVRRASWRRGAAHYASESSGTCAVPAGTTNGKTNPLPLPQLAARATRCGGYERHGDAERSTAIGGATAAAVGSCWLCRRTSGTNAAPTLNTAVAAVGNSRRVRHHPQRRRRRVSRGPLHHADESCHSRHRRGCAYSRHQCKQRLDSTSDVESVSMISKLFEGVGTSLRAKTQTRHKRSDNQSEN